MKKLVRNIKNNAVCTVSRMKMSARGIVNSGRRELAKEPGLNAFVTSGILIIVGLVVAAIFGDELEAFVEDIFTIVDEKIDTML